MMATKIGFKTLRTAGLALLLPALLSACRSELEQVVLASYNVGAFSKEIEDSTPMVADLILSEGLETVALQELDSCNLRHPVFQAARLADILNSKSETDRYTPLYASAMPYREGSYGIGIITKDRVKKSYSIPLPKLDGSEPRVCLVMETKKYVFASTHLDHISQEARLSGAILITEVLKKRYSSSGKPVFLAGDLNDTPDSPLLEELRKDWHILSTQDCTYPASDPSRRIDYILVLCTISMKDSGRIDTLDGVSLDMASDHLPIYVKVLL